jgi:DNA-binding beta-propeller fold protein YncE
VTHFERLLIGVLAMTAPLRGAPPLQQLEGTAACVSETGTAGACANGVALDGAAGVALSPDGRNVYVATFESDAVVVFDRDPETGALTQKAGTDGCVSDNSTGGGCVEGVALDGASGVALSPNGRTVYVVSQFSDAVVVFDREVETGVLTQKAGTAGCVSVSGTGGACVEGTPALNGASRVAVSGDGRNVYVVAFNAVVVMDRDPATGALAEKAGTDGCVHETGGSGCADVRALLGPTDLALSRDGGSVYVASQASDAVAVFERNLATGVLAQDGGTDGCVSETGSETCADGVALNGPDGVAVSPDGRTVYVASRFSSAVAVLDRDVSTGALTQPAGPAGCISSSGHGGACSVSAGVGTHLGVTVSPDGASVFVAAEGNAVGVFERDLASGALTQQAGVAGCISETGGACTDGVALLVPVDIAVDAVSGQVYVASFGSDAVAVFDRDPAAYDIDGDGSVDPLTDGLLLLRYSFGFTGPTLITGAVDLVNCTRCTAAAIEAFLAALGG